MSSNKNYKKNPTRAFVSGIFLLLFMSQELIDVVYFFSFPFIEDSPDDKVDNRKLWNELEIEGPVEGEPTSQSC